LLALLIAAPSSVGAMDFASLRAQISAHDITTVDGLVQVLPESLRSDYTLAFHSRSLQGASYDSPRAILFGDDASLVFTFNGDPSERGYDAVETMEFDAFSGSFRFREIQFGVPGAPPTISDANPVRCTACHGTPARPIWDTPPSWPGVYGERYRSGLSAQETRGMREFLALQPNHPRYRALMGSRRFGERDTYVTSSTAMYNGPTTEPPNARLSMLLTQLNTRAIMATLRSQPGYEAHRYVLLAAAERDCGSLEDFYPSALRASLVVQLREFLDSLERVDRRQEAAKAARLTDGKAPRSLGGRPFDMGQLRFAVEHGLGISTEFWTLAFERNTYDLASPPGTWSLGEALFEAVTSTDSKLADLHASRSFDSGDAYCKRLSERSRQALESWYTAAAGSLPSAERSDSGATGAPALGASGSAPAALCVACHSGEIAQKIPFGNPEALASMLIGGHYPRGRLLDEILYRLSDAAGTERMPRGTLLSRDQVRALETYFVGLANGPRDSR
jgi:mono/diheme cytochrome c family protein